MDRRKAGLAALAAGLAAIGLQALPWGLRHNPAVHPERTIEAHLEVPPEVSRILSKACRDCHSNQTRWPWYGRIAPMSWALAHDIGKARRAWNYSEWSEGPGRRPGVAMATLFAACEGVRTRRMPLPQYRMLHPESRLTEAETRTFCEWTVRAASRLAVSKEEKKENVVSLPSSSRL